jgi:GT2 family glycosyltransferase
LLLSIIIVNYNTGVVLKECVESYYKFENISDSELIIIDNCSKDSSKEIIEKLSRQHNSIRSFFLDKQVSFSAANNTGFKACSGEYVLIMNPDIVFTKPVLQGLLDKYKSIDNLGAISPALVSENSKFQYDYFQRYPSLMQYLVYYTILSKIFLKLPWFVNGFVSNHDINIESGKLYFTEQLPCAFFLTRSEIFSEVGMMDEKFWLFFEDVDLSYRINKKYKLAVDTSCKVTHLGGASIRNADDWWVYGRTIISMAYFFKKHYAFIKTTLLKIFSVSNSALTLSVEYLMKIFTHSETYRIKKHKYYLKLFKENFL